MILSGLASVFWGFVGSILANIVWEKLKK